MSGIARYTGPWTKATAKHLANRTLFGARLDDIEHFLQIGMDNAVSELLTLTPAPSPPVNYYQNIVNDSNQVPYGSTWVNLPILPFPNDPLVIVYRRNALKAWWLNNLINQQRSLTEKMIVFWHNHFATEFQSIPVPQASYKYVNTLRQYALGNFKTLTKEITMDPSMLYYLNGYLNSATAPDENYARELMELFTLGKGPGSQYTESDVKAAARLLTGYRFNPYSSPVSFLFDPNSHDTGNKTFSSFFNNTVIQGRSGLAGINELDDLLNMIFAQNEVALFMMRRIYKFFVYYKIDNQVENDVIVPLAQIFRSNNYNIVPVLETLFKSEHFYDIMSQSCLIKSPLDYMVGLFRIFNIQRPLETDYETFYSVNLRIQEAAKLMGQDIGDPPSVSGWPAYYQIPSYHQLWINSDYFAKRIEVIDNLLNGITVNGYSLKIDIVNFTDQFPNPEDPNQLVNDAMDLLLALPLSQNGKDYYKSILLSGQSQDYYWTDAWITYKNTPINHPDYAMNYNVVYTRLLSFYTQLLKQSEFHLS